MQRRDLNKSTRSSALLSMMPINHFSQKNKYLTHLFQANSEDTKLIESIHQLKTQTTTVKCNDKEVKIHAIQTGSVAVKQAHRSHRNSPFFDTD